MITTVASTKGLGATLWQKQKDGYLKPIGTASRYLSDTEKKYAINEVELLTVVWGLEHFRLYIEANRTITRQPSAGTTHQKKPNEQNI